jgi:hypothetical protein
MGWQSVLLIPNNTNYCQRTIIIDPVNMSDGTEVNNYGTDPNNQDTDGDGIEDGQEIRNGTDPLTP